ncbi:BREX system P-loop protein BrxC [Nocardia sp. CA-128927]|uniref:BREX system P-loop protein BrxC n=1 Tax=Nocardia sp. CA-128927 TaxID=3239975 RepID=UPI003D96EEE1
MLINDILAKPIDRALDGVVKASNVAQLRTEVSEYVVTSEIAQHLDTLLEVYTHPGDPQSNGVWIAGFFGSGKSHLLKMLAHLLGEVRDSAITRVDVAAEFADKIDENDALLRAALQRSVSIPARSLLFNIDEKVDKHEKDQADALLKVFVQVFYEACGYFGKQPYIARFERDLAGQGHLAAFEVAFERHFGQPWSQGRELAVFAEQAAELAYTDVTGTTVHQPLTGYRDSYSVSIESFAEEVAQWLATQPEPGLRLNFFVDEIGQFIGDNQKLMLSLQTIAESLFTHCHGRSWVVVTSQEMMDTIIGDRTKGQKMDFSKIQARFTVQLKLDSKNVREVVSKRLLAKTTPGAEELARVYASNADRFRSLFAFQGQRTYTNYASAADFIDIYPFVDYQFELFHAAMRGLSDNDGFTGKHASVGERSLLGVTKEIGSALKAQPVGRLATFDRFYDGIENSLLSSVKHNVHTAEDHLDGPDKALAVQVLKALLLTKWNDQFNATPQALAVLLTPAIDTNIAALREDIDRALQRLVINTYVQRNGSTYTYLTDEEQDVEKAIKAVELNDGAVKQLLNEEIVAAAAIGAKVRHDATGTDLGLERWLDGERYGRSEPLGIHFVTSGGDTVEDVQQRSTGYSGTVYVMLDLDQRTLAEIQLAVRTKDYYQQQLKKSLPDSRRRILDAHDKRNIVREREVRATLRAAVAAATFVQNGGVLAIAGSTAKERVHAALQIVIEAKYTRINEARGVVSLAERDLTSILRENHTLDFPVTSSLDALTQAVINRRRQEKTAGQTTTVAALVGEFGNPPFGWSMLAVLVALAHGVKTGRVRLHLDGRVLVRTEIPGELRNTAKHRNIIVDEVRAQDPAKVRALRAFLTDFSDAADPPSSTEDLVRQVRARLAATLTEVTDWIPLNYPFAPRVRHAHTVLCTATEQHDDDWYLDGFLSGLSATLLDVKVDVLDPVRAFLKGSQKKIVDDAATFLDTGAEELDLADTAEIDRLRALLDNPNFLRGNAIPQIKQLTEELCGRVSAAVAADRAALHDKIDQRRGVLRDEPAFRDATVDAQTAAEARFTELLTEIDVMTTRGQLAFADARIPAKYQAIVETLLAAHPADPEDDAPEPTGQESAPSGGGTPERRPTTSPSRPTTVHLGDLTVTGAPAMLRTPEQVDIYLAALRDSLLAALAQGRTVIR